MTRLFRLLWFFSLIASVVVLLYVYASHPETAVDLFGNDAYLPEKIEREPFFYWSLLILSAVNFILYTVSYRLARRKTDKKAFLEQLISWTYGFAAVINGFFIVVLLMILLVNIQEKYDYNYFTYLIYIASGLIVVWIVWLMVLVVRALAGMKLRTN